MSGRVSAAHGAHQGHSLERHEGAVTRISDPYAFVTAFARGIEHPRVREKLDMPYGPDATRYGGFGSARKSVGANPHPNEPLPSA